MFSSKESKVPLPGSARRRPDSSVLQGPLDPKQIVHFTVLIRRPPNSPPIPDLNYWQQTPVRARRTISQAEYNRIYSATEEDLGDVTSFLASYGLKTTECYAARRTVSVSGTPSEIRAAFGVQLNNYVANVPAVTSAGTYVHRGFEGEIVIPSSLSKVIVAVVGLDDRRLVVQTAPSGEPPGTQFLTPAAAASHYNFPQIDCHDQTIGVFAPQSEPGKGCGYLQADVASYLATLPKAFQSTPSFRDVTLTVGGKTYRNEQEQVMQVARSTDWSMHPWDWILELTLDLSTVATTAQGATLNVYFTADSEDGLVAFLKRILVPDSEMKPSVVTSSFVAALHDDVGIIGSLNDSGSLISVVHTTLQELAYEGVSFFNSAGDWGSSNQMYGKRDGKAHVGYMSSDPWLTCVGGTVLAPDASSPLDWTEVVWSNAGPGEVAGSTGGGVSSQFPAPPYQVAARITGAADNDGFVRSGRVIPDIAGTVRLGGFIVNGLASPNVEGTSLTTPFYAGLFATIRSALGEPFPLLNPLLYQLGRTHAFNDVTVGNNDPDDGSPFFEAKEGFDACTGWGSVDGTRMLSGIASLLHKPSLYFVVEKPTFSLDEVRQAKFWPASFSLVLEGFGPASLPVGLPTLSGPFANLSDVSISLDAGQPELRLSPSTPQRIVFKGSILFGGQSHNAASGAFSTLR